MTRIRSLFAELKRRNVWRAALVYIAAVWALSQGISQLSPSFGIPDWVVRWFVVASAIGFPFWVAFAWFYAWTPQGFRRESEVAPHESIAKSTGRRLDFWIIGVLGVAVALLASGYFIHRPSANDANAASARSVAVLPFQNLSNDKTNEYFVAGMQDLILTKLADIGGLKVIARTSTRGYASHPDDLATIGRQLGVATILEGSVQKQGQQVLISVRLVDVHSADNIWAQSYTRTLDNVFGVEGDVAEKVADALKAKLSPGETALLATDMSSNAAANDAFLAAEYQANQGNVNYDTASMKAAIPLYRKAVALDPGFALAFARLSYVESHLAWFGGGGLDVKQLNAAARDAAERAIKLAPNSPASYLALGYSDYYGRLDYAAALDDFGKALTLRPSGAEARTAQGYVQRRQGRFKAALLSLQDALELDPRNSALAFEVGTTCMLVGRYPEAERWTQRALALQPDNLNAKAQLSNAILFASSDIAQALTAAAGDAPALELQRVTLLTYQRNFEGALALLARIPDTPDNFGPGANFGGPKVLMQATLYRLLGDTARARPLYAQALPIVRAQLELQQGVNKAIVWSNVASAELGLGHRAQALAAISAAQAINAKARDQFAGPPLMEVNATLYAQAGRADLAVPLLAKALASPGIGYYYAPSLLWLDPAWDPIRHDSGFLALQSKYADAKPKAIPAPTAAATDAATP